MKEEQFSSIKFDEVAFPRYVKVKESIENLTKIIDFEKTKEDGMDRVLHAILQLIDENDDKTVDEKREVIEDAIYNGNVFKHYFTEENRTKAVDVLSKTSLLNDEERLIYIINFFMPSDVNFSSTYSKLEKDIEKIAEHYELTNSDSNNLVYARVAEISKFYKLYQEEKERQRIQILAAMQDASENPSVENIERARDLLGDLTDVSLKETLEQQLTSLEQDENEQENITGNFDVEEFLIPNEEPIEEVTEESVEEFVQDDNLEGSTLEVTEPALLEEVLEEQQKDGLDNNVGKEVMDSLQNLVASSKKNAMRVEQLSLDLEAKDEEIAKLQTTIDAKNQEIEAKSQDIIAKEEEVQEKSRIIEEQDERIASLQAEVAEKDMALNNASKLVSVKDEEISALTMSLNSYKASLGEIQKFLSAQTSVELDENPRKVA